MCNKKKSTGSTERVLDAQTDEDQLEDDVFSDTESGSQASVNFETALHTTLEEARAAVDVDNVYDHWNKKTFFEKLDAVSLDFW